MTIILPDRNNSMAVTSDTEFPEDVETASCIIDLRLLKKALFYIAESLDLGGPNEEIRLTLGEGNGLLITASEYAKGGIIIAEKGFEED